MKIIFLDVDGVLNGYNFWNTLGWRLVCLINNNKLKQWYRNTTEPFGIHTPKFKRFAKIVRKTGAKVVISSCWKRRLMETPANEMDKHEIKFWYLCNKYNIDICGITPYSNNLKNRRQDEILTWLLKHQDVDKFVILDDERYDLEEFVGKGLVQTSSVKKNEFIMGHWQEDTGLKNKHVRQAIKILNG